MNSVMCRVIEALSDLPKDMYLGIGWASWPESRVVSIQAYDQKHVKQVQEFLGLTNWREFYNDRSEWWEYWSDHEGVQFQIYACKEAPVVMEVAA